MNKQTVKAILSTVILVLLINSETTRINLYLPLTVNKAQLYIYNMQGNQVNSFPINERENTSVTIEGHSLKAGMYLYTLIADGKEVDTKKMILTK